MFMRNNEITSTTSSWQKSPQCAVQIIFVNKFLAVYNNAKYQPFTRGPASVFSEVSTFLPLYFPHYVDLLLIEQNHQPNKDKSYTKSLFRP
jgi:hypothetical protein